MLRAIPLLAIVVVLYNLVALVTGPDLAQSAVSVTLPSGVLWVLAVGDLLVAIGLFLLYCEIFKATVISGMAALDHALSMALFVICLIEFMLVRACGTSVFMLLTLLCFIDVVAGFSISVATARRDVSVDRL